MLLRAFGEQMDLLLSEEQRRLKSQMCALTFETEDDDIGYIGLELEYDKLCSEFPSLFRSTFFAKAANEFETILLGIAENHLSSTKTTITLRDLREKGIHKAKLYFTKVANLPFPSESNHWWDICRLAEIRNAVVHGDSQLSNDRKQELEKFFKKPSIGIVRNQDGAITFTSTAASAVICVYIDFLNEFRRKLK